MTPKVTYLVIKGNKEVAIVWCTLCLRLDYTLLGKQLHLMAIKNKTKETIFNLMPDDVS